MFPFAILPPPPVFGFERTISVSSNTPYNIKTAAIAAGWDEVLPIVAVITINSGVVQGSNSSSTPALDTGTTFPAGSAVSVINNGTLKGKGGIGGQCRWQSAASGYWNPISGPGSGGDAFRAAVTTTFTNNGEVSGGGGGGAQVGGYTGDYSAGGAAGGGGAGAAVGDATYLTSEVLGHLEYSTAGTATTGGAGTSYSGVDGGAGGALGAAGANGVYYNFGGGTTAILGGTAGKAATGKSYINGGAGITGGTLNGAQT